MPMPESATDIVVDDRIADEHGLTPEEYASIKEHLGRVPTFEELGVFSVMWSEHCSYKSSRVHLKKFPTDGPHVLQGPGENAGGIDIGGGMAAIFKIESHNHPSFIEPYQGAATGVGGILRDIFTMGARPVANMNSLRFGAADHEKTPFLLNGVVAGVGGYGNSVGVATVGGEVHFDAGYDGNILVNAFTLGVVEAEKILRAKAAGPGNPILYVGSKTGRDGIHGASLLASTELKDESEQMKPTVQVGDPFKENLLIEACLEVMPRPEVVAVQDMGAAGLTSSTVEMASRGGVGVHLDLDRIPLRDPSLTPYEMLLSESQERMVVIVKQGTEAEISRIFAKWDLDCVVVGEVTDDGLFRTSFRGNTVTAIPVDALTDAAPAYDRPIAAPAGYKLTPVDPASVPVPSNLQAVFLQLLGSPNLSSRCWVFEQYDQFVGANTMIGPGGDAAVVRVRENGGALAMSADCNSRHVELDPFGGGTHAVAEAARNVAVTGAVPSAISDCLNFGNPEKPEVMWQFTQAIEGMSEACRAFETPVISGNVSFYNDNQGRSIPPTPVVTMVGIIEDSARVAGAGFRREGDEILLLGHGHPHLDGSEYLEFFHERREGAPPRVDLAREIELCALLVDLISLGTVDTAHDIADGGLAIALAEMSLLSDGLGCDVVLSTNKETDRSDTVLFGESAGRVLIGVAADQIALTKDKAARFKVPITSLGSVTTDRFTIKCKTGSAKSTTVIDLAPGDLREAHAPTLERIATGNWSRAEHLRS